MKPHSSKAAWLRENQAVWRGYRLTDNVVQNVFHMLQCAGLYSFKTNAFDAQNGIRNHIARLRAEKV